MIERGDPARLGATAIAGGVNFALYSEVATRIELCLFDADGRDRGRFDLPACDNHVWHGFVPGLTAGTHYGYRVHGPWQPQRGLRCNPAKLLLDPYARRLAGDFQWHARVFGHNQKDPSVADRRDSAPSMPKCVVVDDTAPLRRRVARPWHETLIYEANVRGLTMLHPALDATERGKFRGLGNRAVIEHLRALGITAIELLPVHAFIDEHFLHQQGKRNAWGYNTMSFFAPMPRYANHDPIGEFRAMVDALHDANIEVILDVVYNHTAEGDHNGPTLSLRGIDNATYYRLPAHAPEHYINDTGTGNTLNADHPAARNLVVDSLRYWAAELGVDGFRFDLAPILGRHATGFDRDHPLLTAIGSDNVLRHCKLIAEPWDVGPGGYQLGNFPRPWSEWNDRYRDSVRQYWRGDDRQAPGFVRCLHGSADIFEGSGRQPRASINFITSHDGFTLHDLTSYEKPHNLANGEDNRDGHQHNYSANYGHEGDTSDAAILGLRRRQRLNMLATLLFSQGTPMLLAGDELGNSQRGNNNAYAQDNDIGWIDWQRADLELLHEVRELIALRQKTPLLRQTGYRHGHSKHASGYKNIEWLAPDGTAMQGLDWHHAQALAMLLCATPNDNPPAGNDEAVILLMNPASTLETFTLPELGAALDWQLIFHSASDAPAILDGRVTVGPHALALLKLFSARTPI